MYFHKSIIKMTIYYLDLKLETLARLPSSQVVLELCNHICTQVMIHIQEVVLRNDPSAAAIMSKHRADLHCQLDLLKTSTFGYQPGDEVRMRIEYLYLRKRATKFHPSFRSGFGMDNLQSVPPVILILLLDKLLKDGLESIRGYITGVSRFTLAACIKTLREISSTLATLCGIDFNRRSIGLGVAIQFIVGDFSDQVVHLV